ncbi:phenylacetate--CoA ligase [Variovorax sp. V118]|uniref:phenylacetate--CoA ligase PaaK n=1 Tax=Variovorax sp. V118 TaxID=3065954 RepID=UPI0034E8CBB1
MTKVDREVLRGADLEPIETASVDELRALQIERLGKSLAHTYENVAIYRAKCDAKGIHPNDLHSLDDLKNFPFSTKEDFRVGYPFGMFAVPTTKLARIHASSGTTGKPAVVGYTRNDIETWANIVARSIRACGGRPGDTVHVAYNYGMFTGGLGSHYGAERLGCAVMPVSGGQTERQVQLMVDLRPTVIMVTPSYLLNIADEIDRQGIKKEQLALRIALVGAEPWTESMRQEINKRLNLRAMDYYGISEIMGPGVAAECAETEDGPTLWEDHFYPEIIDPVTAEVLPEGSYGELVLTSLTKEAVPVMRYRTRDLTRLLPGTARTMRRLDRFTGRSDDMMIVRGVNVFPSQVEEQILSLPAFSGHYLIELTREGALDNIKIHVEPRSDWVGDAQQSAAELHRRIKMHVGISTQITLSPAGGLERSQGKAKRVIDRRRVG